jgi:uncharacterized membrane protein YcgQ (UPF0703/DUF1980 family)
MFITQIDDIILNQKSYLGRTIRLEGLFRRNHWNDKDYYFVIRTTPGCCGDDGQAGFEISWNPDHDASGNDIDQRQKFPEINEWVQVTGELKSYDFHGLDYLFLVLSELNVLETRGAEFVSR